MAAIKPHSISPIMSFQCQPTYTARPYICIFFCFPLGVLARTHDWLFLPGQGRPVQAANNLNHSQNRAVSNGRMLSGKPSTWAQAGLPPVTPSSQPNREPVAPDNWAQAMNTRTNTQLDLSASSYVNCFYPIRTDSQ